ncbi:MAG: hypothetical protein PHV55_02160 [Candidatus Omnitrophica bacterium]|nr:hypothetical protein [Candidatus Omnitrophota bacterium]
MNKKQLILACFIFAFSSLYAFAQENEEKVDWDKIEYHLARDLKAKFPDKSEAELEQAIGGALLQVDNQWERATVHFKKAVQLDSGLYFAWYNLGLINIDTKEGYNYFKKAIESNPGFANPYYWMAYYRCRNREDKKAIPLFQKYLEVARNNEAEAGRVKIAEEVLQDLLAGREGNSLNMMRRPSKEIE